jgi:hypothetical protein
LLKTPLSLFLSLPGCLSSEDHIAFMNKILKRELLALEDRATRISLYPEPVGSSETFLPVKNTTQRHT